MSCDNSPFSLPGCVFFFLSVVTTVSLPPMLPYSFHHHTDCSPQPQEVGVRGEGKGVHRCFRSDHTSLIPWHNSRNRLNSHLVKEDNLWFGAMVTKGCDSEIAKNTVLINYRTSTCGKTGNQCTGTDVSGNWQLNGTVLDFWISLLLELIDACVYSTTELQL